MKNTSQIIRRADLTKNFCIIPNHIAQSTKLSPNSKSLLIHLLSMPNDWVYNKTHFWRVTNLGRNAFNAAWKELEDLSYIQSERVKDGNLVRGYNYIISDLPIFGLTENGMNQNMVNQSTDNPNVGKLLKTNKKKENINKDVLNKDVSTNKAIPRESQVGDSEIISMSYGEINNRFGIPSREATIWQKYNL